MIDRHKLPLQCSKLLLIESWLFRNRKLRKAGDVHTLRRTGRTGQIGNACTQGMRRVQVRPGVLEEPRPHRARTREERLKKSSLCLESTERLERTEWVVLLKELMYWWQLMYWWCGQTPRPCSMCLHAGATHDSRHIPTRQTN